MYLFREAATRIHFKYYRLYPIRSLATTNDELEEALPYVREGVSGKHC